MMNSKKIFEMLEEQGGQVAGLNDEQRNRLVQLCQKIYLFEASNKNTPRRNIEELTKEITFVSGRMKDLGDDP